MLITISDCDLQAASLDLKIAAEAIMHGGTVIVGTETFYAIAANPFMDEAVEKIFSIKKRSFQNPLALIASNQKVVDSRISGFSKIAETLMKDFWPGSLTILFAGKVDFSKYVECFGQHRNQGSPDVSGTSIGGNGRWLDNCD